MQFLISWYTYFPNKPASTPDMIHFTYIHHYLWKSYIRWFTDYLFLFHYNSLWYNGRRALRWWHHGIYQDFNNQSCATKFPPLCRHLIQNKACTRDMLHTMAAEVWETISLGCCATDNIVRSHSLKWKCHHVNFCHWLHWKMPFWQPLQTILTIFQKQKQ